MLIELFSSVLKCCTQCVSVSLCFARAYLDMPRAALSLSLMILTVNNVTSNSLNYILIGCTASLIIIHICSIPPLGLFIEISLEISMSK